MYRPRRRLFCDVGGGVSAYLGMDYRRVWRGAVALDMDTVVFLLVVGRSFSSQEARRVSVQAEGA